MTKNKEYAIKFEKLNRGVQTLHIESNWLIAPLFFFPLKNKIWKEKNMLLLWPNIPKISILLIIVLNEGFEAFSVWSGQC